MRKLRFLAVMMILVAAPELALGQAETAGPPDAVAKRVDTTARDAKPEALHRTARRKKIAHRGASHAADGFTADRAASSSRELALPASGTAPADPLSFGMKWNGNSDNARETRIQNYNATATGSGAEVGMKLHF